MKKPNYDFIKRQKEMKKKQKQEKKRLEKFNKANAVSNDTTGLLPGEGNNGNNPV